MPQDLLLKLAYDGTRYHGWQIQENALTVQQVFQEALERITGLKEDIKACSRTDTGVHAREFCVSLRTESPIAPERLVAALNHYLPQDIAVRSCAPVPPGFHARYSCKGKEYVYQIWNHPVRDPFLAGRALHYWYPMDEALLDQAAQHYVGRHDFSSFCTLDKREKGDLTRTVTHARVQRQGTWSPSPWRRTAFCTTWCASWWGRFCGCSRENSPPRTSPASSGPGTGRRRGPPPRPAACT